MGFVSWYRRWSRIGELNRELKTLATERERIQRDYLDAVKGNHYGHPETAGDARLGAEYDRALLNNYRRVADIRRELKELRQEHD